jgi:site-specific DNA-methyltransferase (adenine-specific)
VKPYFEDEQTTIYNGDCREILQTLPDDSVDAVVTDPPYGLAFMGKRWDYDVPSIEVWAECLRILKPGGHLLAFAGTRTQHRMAVKIEDAGFEIRDMIAWVYGSGFPKSLDVSKAIDKAAGAEREVVRVRTDGNKGGGAKTYDDDSYVWDKPFAETAPATSEAAQWDGWGTALKPALEPITVARKPLCGTVAENVLQYGTGGINVDGCRVQMNGETPKGSGSNAGWCISSKSGNGGNQTPAAGRWPANLIHDGSEEVTGLFLSEDGEKSAARFFYTAKADKADRGHSNNHPTVKPQALMRYLVRLVCQPGGVVLDPFGGSGTTAAAARLEQCRSILCELSAEYCDIAVERLRQRVPVADPPERHRRARVGEQPAQGADVRGQGGGRCSG